MAVPARISLVTLGVSDVARATEFYESLGWRTSSASVPGEISFLHTGGARLILWSREELGADVAMAMNVEAPERVAEILDEVQRAGATLVKPSTREDWGGTSGCFADPDGHVWEVAHNPGFPLHDDGSVDLPE